MVREQLFSNGVYYKYKNNSRWKQTYKLLPGKKPVCHELPCTDSNRLSVRHFRYNEKINNQNLGTN